MQRLEVSAAVRPIYGSLGFKRLTLYNHRDLHKTCTEPLLQASSRCAKLSSTYSINTYIYVNCPIVLSLII